MNSNVFGNNFFGSGDVVANNTATYRNRIINGNMAIDQRWVGSAVSLNNGGSYIMDRFFCYNGSTSTITTQQLTLGNSGAPPIIPNQTFTNCLTFTNNSTAANNTAANVFVNQIIEGYNLADNGWGSSGGKNMTVSFWVYASLVGTYSFAILSSNAQANYTTTYAITTTNTWKRVTITIPSPTIGSWDTTVNIGANLTFTLNGSTNGSSTSSLNSWQNPGSAYYISTTQTNFLNTASSTFSITGLQFEIGSNATSFEYRARVVEMALAQRFFEKSYDYAVIPGALVNSITPGFIWSTAYSSGSNPTNYALTGFQFNSEKRTIPTVTLYHPGIAQTQNKFLAGSDTSFTNAGNSVTGYNLVTTKSLASFATSAVTANAVYFYHYTVSADF